MSINKELLKNGIYSGDLTLGKNDPEITEVITEITGTADLEGYTYSLPALTTIGGTAYLRGYTHSLPALTTIGGDAYLEGYGHAIPTPLRDNSYCNQFYNQNYVYHKEARIELPNTFLIPEGDIIGWKKINSSVIAKLLIPSHAKRTKGPNQRKCRTEFAKVLELKFINSETVMDSVVNYAYSDNLIYRAGELVYPDKYDGYTAECSHGINFFLNEIEAINY